MTTQTGRQTQEPWHVSGSMVCASNGRVICTIPLQDARPANARLIAAAPDLLDAAQLGLKEAESWIHDQLDGTSWVESALKKLEPIRAAIRKATQEVTP